MRALIQGSTKMFESLKFSKSKLVVLAAALVVSGCGGSSGNNNRPPPPPPNNPPSANAGPDQTVARDVMVTLDGSVSSDPDEHYPLTYAWSIVDKPAGSTAALSDPSSVSPSFGLDVAGDYTIELIVSDNLGADSEPALVHVTAIAEARVGASVSGISPFMAACVNNTTRHAVWIPLQGTSVDCEAAGLVVNPGDDITLYVRGIAH